MLIEIWHEFVSDFRKGMRPMTHTYYSAEIIWNCVTHEEEQPKGDGRSGSAQIREKAVSV